MCSLLLKDLSFNFYLNGQKYKITWWHKQKPNGRLQIDPLLIYWLLSKPQEILPEAGNKEPISHPHFGRSSLIVDNYWPRKKGHIHVPQNSSSGQTTFHFYILVVKIQLEYYSISGSD